MTGATRVGATGSVGADALATAVLRRARPSAWGPGLAVLAAAAAAWLAFGVGLGEIVVFLAYELAFVVLPGCALARLLLPGWRGLLPTVAVGCALGYVLEILAFMLTAELGVRGAFWLLPLTAPAFLLAARRRPVSTPVREGPVLGRAERWAVSGLSALVVAYLAIAYFGQTPLPWQVDAVTYYSDLPFHLSLAAEAKHHWPVTDPNVAGLDYPYHLWAHFQVAAVSQVTGLELALVLFRLLALPLAVLFVVQVAVAGRAITGRAWVGPMAAGLAFFTAELDLEPRFSFPFLGYFPLDFWLSPTFLLGLVFFVPVLTILAARMADRGPVRAAWREWIALSLLLVGCAGAKATILPVVVGGLTLVIGWRLWRDRAVDRQALAALSLATGVLALFHVALYRHAGSLGLGLDPLGTIRSMPRLLGLRQHFGGGVAADRAFWAGATILGLLGLFGAALAGLPALLRSHGLALDPVRVALLALFVAGLGPFLLFDHEGESQLFFSHYGLVAACILSAEGLRLLVTRATQPRRIVARAVVAFGGAWVLALLLVSVGVESVLEPLPAALRYAAAAAVVAAVVALLLRVPLPDPTRWVLTASLGAPVAIVFVLAERGRLELGEAPYGFFVVGLLTASLVLLVGRGSRALAAPLIVTALVSAGALDLPLDHGPDTVSRLRRNGHLYLQNESRLTAELLRGLRWVRENTDEDTVLAGNTYYERAGEAKSPTWYYYAALAERRIFLEGWFFTPRAHEVGGRDVRTGVTIPFPERLRLNEAVFTRADRGALRRLVDEHGVDLLLVDRRNGGQAPQVSTLGRVVYRSPAVQIVDVRGAGARQEP